jgi:hypothetical protein
VFAIVGSGREFPCVREGERTLTDLWFAAHELKLSRVEGVPIDRELRVRVRREFPPPPAIDFRMRPQTPEEEIEAEERDGHSRSGIL